jgi:NADH dehydrogenase
MFGKAVCCKKRGDLFVMVLITGSTGFIGKVLLKQLVGIDVDVRIFLKPSSQSPSLPRGIAFDVAVASSSDLRGIRAALNGIQTVIHLASNERYGQRGYDTDREIQGTRNLADAAAEAGIEQIIFLSHLGANSTSAYPVLRTKAIQEEVIRKSGVPYTIIRSSIVYGPQDHFTTSIAMQLSLLPLIYLLPGSGDTLLQPLWVKDLTTAISWTMDDPATLGQTYEIGGPEFLTYKQILEMVMATVRRHRITIPFRPPYLRIGAKLAERLFWDPPFTCFWLDYLAVHRTTALASLPSVFSLQPTRMESNLDYLKNRAWLKELFLYQFLKRREVA